MLLHFGLGKEACPYDSSICALADVLRMDYGKNWNRHTDGVPAATRAANVLRRYAFA